MILRRAKRAFERVPTSRAARNVLDGCARDGGRVDGCARLSASFRGAFTSRARDEVGTRRMDRLGGSWRGFAASGGSGRVAESASGTAARADAVGAVSVLDHRNPFMTRERVIRMLPGERGIVRTSASSAFGHLSFLLLGYSYLTSDLLTLRALAVGGLSATMVFQYFRDVPLWLPLRWNALFVAINVFWVVKLWYENHEAERWCTAEERALYDRHFSHMALADYRTLLKIGRWRDLEVGTELTTEGRQNSSVCVILDGAADVYVGGKLCNTLPAGSFVGEMSLMRSIGAKVNQNGNKPREASATVVISERARALQWNDAELRQLLRENEQIKSGIQAAFGVGLAEKLLKTRLLSTKTLSNTSPDVVRGALAH